MTSRLLVRFAAPVLLITLTAATACGSSSTGASGVPSLNGSGASNSVTTTTVNPTKAVGEFVKCLRDQGIDVADPKVGADGQIDLRSVFQSANVQRDSATFRTARDKCGKFLANAGFGPNSADRQNRQKAMLAFTACLRGQGLTVSDPTFGRGGFGGGPGGGGAPDGAPGGAPGAGGPSTSAGATGGGANNGPGRDGPPATQEERVARLAERLNLDPNDAKVKAAFTACNTELTAATARRGFGATTTTTAG